MRESSILKVAVPGPFRKLFDYLPIKTSEHPIPPPGCRVLIPFGKRNVVGILVDASKDTVQGNFELKTIQAYLDEEALFDPPTLKWLTKIAQYYHHPLGETLLTALPVVLRKAQPSNVLKNVFFTANPNIDLGLLKRAPKQFAILQYLQTSAQPVDKKTLNSLFPNNQIALNALLEKKLITSFESTRITDTPISCTNKVMPKGLNAEQVHVVEQIRKYINEFRVTLLNGVTGSGKTEVYINICKTIVDQGKQILILLPEIALTPQLVERFKNQFNCAIEILHSGLNDTERYTVWQNVKDNRTQILIGTRSSIFSPFKHLGLIIIDEEHDLSFKQQDGLRYSTRDIAILRASALNIPVVLGSATPSLESIFNTSKSHYQHLHLKHRAGNAIPPKISTLNIKGKPLIEGLANELILQIKSTLARKEQVLLFLNQRGYAPALICHQCGSVEKCPRCERNMTIHQARNRITCHHCGFEKKLPDQCNVCGQTDLRPIGYGTERIESGLKQLFPDIDIIRIDRDTTSRKHAIHTLLQQVDNQKAQILLGTQMLAKGHDFPNVTLVGLLNADQGLFGVDLRSEERLAQLVTQVAGRAGRSDKPGYVVIQTHNPDHPLWHTLINASYDEFAQQHLAERKAAQLPPFSYSALFRAESSQLTDALVFLRELSSQLTYFSQNGIEIYGPVPAPMEKKAGKYRTQLLLMSQHREKLHQCINYSLKSIEQLKSARKIRWSLDVDPLDMS